MAETKTINLEVKTNVPTLKQQYKEAVKEVQAMASAFGETSIEVANAAKRAAELKDRIEDANDAIAAFKGEGAFLATGKAIGSVADGFSAVEGAMGLLGVESENLQKAMLRVQSAMALSQGLAGLEDAGRAFSQLKTVVIGAYNGMTTAAKIFTSVGILALVSGIIYLVQNVKQVTRAFEDFTDWLGLTNNAAIRNAKAIEDNAKRVSKANDMVIASSKKRSEATTRYYDNEIALAQINGKDTTKLEIEKSQKLSEQSRERYKTLLKELEDLKGNNKKYAVERRRALKEQVEEERIALQEERNTREQARAQAKADRLEDYKEQKEEREQQARERYEQASRDLTDIRDNELKPIELEKIKIRQEGLQALQGQLNEEAEMKRLANERELLELQVKGQRAAKIAEQAQSFQVKATLDGLSAIASISELFGKKSEKAAKRAFQVQKAANIATALITTYQNATSAYASQFTPVPTPDSPIRGGIAAGIAVATGLANVAKISQQQFEGGGATGGGGGSAGGSIPVSSPQFNVVGNSGLNQLAQIQQQPVQAYVVSGEVTSAQALDRNRIKNATL